MSFDLALINSDLSLNTDGTVQTVEKVNKLKQDIIKIIVTPITSVKYHLWYCSSVSDSSIGDVMPQNMLFQNLSTAVQESLGKLRRLQRAQATSQRVTRSEMLESVRDISIQRDSEDPRQVNVIVVAISRDYNAVEEVFTIS